MNTSARLTASGPLDLSAPPSPVVPEDSAAWAGFYWLLRRRAWLITGITLLICLAALPAIMEIPKRYYAQTRVLIAPAPALSLTGGMDGRTVGIDIEAELERLVSRGVTDAVISRFGLATRAEFNPALEPASQLDDWMTAVRSLVDRTTGSAAGPARGDSTDLEVRQAFDAALGASLQPGADVITLGFTSRDPALAAAIPAALVETYLAERETRWRREVTDAANWLDVRIRAERERVGAMRAELDSSLGQTGLNDGITEMSIAMQLQTNLERQTEIARERGTLAATRRSVAAALSNPDLAAQSEPERLAMLRTQLGQDLRELRRIAGTYGENNEGVLRLKAAIATMRDDIASGLTLFDRTLEQSDTALAAEQDRLIAEAEAARARLATLQSLAPRIDKQIETLHATEKALSELEFHQQVLLAQARLAPVTVEILSEPGEPHDPIGPGRKMYLLATGFGALLVALTLAALTELRDTTTRSHEELASLPLLLPVGLWPRFSRAARRAMPDAIARRASTPTAEALRDMLVMLECANRGRFPHVLTVASPRTRDLPIPVAEWVALEISASGRPVQLIRTRRPRSGPLLRLFRDTGDRQPAPGSSLRERMLPDIVGQYGGDRSAALQALADEAVELDMITIIDGPPLLSPGALRFARFGGQMLVVLRWGVTPRSVAGLVAALLSKLGAPPVYTLIVDVRIRRHRLYGFNDRLSIPDHG